VVGTALKYLYYNKNHFFVEDLTSLLFFLIKKKEKKKRRKVGNKNIKQTEVSEREVG